MPAKWTGVERWERKLGKLFPAVHRRVGKVLGEEAESLSEAIYRLAPVDEGDLRGSIDYYQVQGYGDLRWRIVEGDDVAFYARMVEFGTPSQRSQPHFYPAYRSHRRRIKSRLTRAVRAGIKDGMRGK